MNEQKFTISLLTPGAFPDLTDNIIDGIEDFLLYAVDSEIQLYISNLVQFFQINLSSFIRSQSLSIAEQHYQKRLLRAMRFFRYKSLTPELSKILEDIAFSFLLNVVPGNSLSLQSQHQAYVFLIDHFMTAVHEVPDRFPDRFPEFAKWSMDFIKLALKDINVSDPSLYLTVLYSFQMLIPYLKKFQIKIGQIVDMLLKIAIYGMKQIKQSNFFDNLEIIIAKTLRVAARLIQTYGQITQETPNNIRELGYLQVDEIAFVHIYQNYLMVACAIIQVDANSRTDEHSNKIILPIIKFFPYFIQMPLLRSHRISFYLKTVEMWISAIKAKTNKTPINILQKVWNLISSFHGQRETIISASNIIQSLISPEVFRNDPYLQANILDNLVSSLEIVKIDADLFDLNQTANNQFEADLWLECNKQIVILICKVIQCDMNQSSQSSLLETYPMTLNVFVRFVRYICDLLDLADSVNQNEKENPLSQVILHNIMMKEFRDQMTYIFDTFVTILGSLQPTFFHQLLSLTMIDLLPRSNYRSFHKFLFTKIHEKNCQILDFQTIFFATLADHFEDLMSNPPPVLLEITRSIFHYYFSDRIQTQQQQMPQINQQMQNKDKKDYLSYDLYRFLIKAITSKNPVIFELLLTIFRLYFSQSSIRFEPFKKIIFESPFSMHSILQMIIDEPKMKDVVSLFALFLYPFCDIKPQNIDFWVKLFLPAIESDTKITAAAIPTLNKYTSRNFAQWVSQLSEPVQSNFVADLAVSPREDNIRILLCKIPDIASRLTLRTFGSKKKESYVIIGGLKIDPEILFNSIKRNPAPNSDDMNILFDAFCQHVGNMKFSEIIKDNLVLSMSEYIQKNMPSKLDTMYEIYDYPQTKYAALFLRQKYGKPIDDVTVDDPNDFLQYISTLCYNCSTVDPALSIIEIFIDSVTSKNIILKINIALVKTSQFRQEKCFKIISEHILSRDYSDDMSTLKMLDNHYHNANYLFPNIRKNANRAISILEERYNLRNSNSDPADIKIKIKKEILSLVNTLFKLNFTDLSNPFVLFDKVSKFLYTDQAKRQLYKIPIEVQHMFKKLGVIDIVVLFFNKIKLIFKILAKLIAYDDDTPQEAWKMLIQFLDKAKSQKLRQFVPYFLKRIRKEAKRVGKTTFQSIPGDYKVLKMFQKMPPSYKELKVVRFFIEFSTVTTQASQQQQMTQMFSNPMQNQMQGQMPNPMNQMPNPMNPMQNSISPMNSMSQMQNPMNPMSNSMNPMQNSISPMNSMNQMQNPISPMSSMNQMQNPMNPMQSSLSPMSSMNQMQNPMNPMSNSMNPMQNSISPMSSMNQMQNSISPMSSMNQMQNPMNPMQNSINPMSSMNQIPNPMNPMTNPMNPMQNSINPMSSMNQIPNPMNPMQNSMKNQIPNQMSQMYLQQMQPVSPMTEWIIKVLESVQSSFENISIKDLPLIRKTEKILKHTFKLTQYLKKNDPNIDIIKFCPIFLDFHIFCSIHMIPINTHFHYFIESWSDELLSSIISKFNSMKVWRFDLFLLIIQFVTHPKANNFRNLIIDQLSIHSNLAAIFNFLDTILKKERKEIIITIYEILISRSVQCIATIMNAIEFSKFDFRKILLLTINILKYLTSKTIIKQIVFQNPSMFVNYIQIFLPVQFASNIKNDQEIFNFYKEKVFPFIQYFHHPLFTRRLVKFMKNLDASHRAILYSIVDSDNDPQHKKPILVNQILCDKYKYFPEETSITVGFDNFVKTPSFPVLVLNFSAALLAANKCVHVNDLANTPILTINSCTHALAISYKLKRVNSIVTLRRFLSVIRFLSTIQDGVQPDGLIDSFTAKLDITPYTLRASSICFRALGQQNCPIDHTSRAITQFILGYSTTVLHSNSASLDMNFVFRMPYVYKEFISVKTAAQRIFEILLQIVVMVLNRGNEGIAIAQHIPQTMDKFIENINFNFVDINLINELKNFLIKKQPSDSNPNQARTKFILQLISVLSRLLFDPISLKINIKKEQAVPSQIKQSPSKNFYNKQASYIFFPRHLLPNDFFSTLNYSKDIFLLYQKALYDAVSVGGYLVSNKIIQEMYDYLHKTTPATLSLPLGSAFATIAEWIKELLLGTPTANNIEMMKLFLEVMKPRTNEQFFIDLVSLKQPLHPIVVNFLISLLEKPEFSVMKKIASMVPATLAFSVSYSIDVVSDCWRIDWFSMCQESHIYAFIRMITPDDMKNFVQFMSESEIKKVITIILNTIPIRYNFQRFILYYISTFPRSSLSECFTASSIFKAAPPYPTLPLFSNMTFLDLINMSDDSLGLLKDKSLELNCGRKKSSAIFNAASFHQVFQFKAAKAYYLKGMNEEEDFYFYALLQLRSISINMTLPLSNNLMGFILNYKKDNAFPVITLPFFQDTQTNFDVNQGSYKYPNQYPNQSINQYMNKNSSQNQNQNQSYSLLNKLTSFISRSHIPFLMHSSLNGEVHQSLKMMRQPENVKNNINEFVRVSNVMWIKSLDHQMMMASNFIWRIAIMDDFFSNNEILSPEEQRQIRDSVIINKNQVIRLLAKSGALSVALKHFPKASYPLTIPVTPQNSNRIYQFIQNTPSFLNPYNNNIIQIPVKQQQRNHQLPIQNPFPVPIQNQMLAPQIQPQIQLNPKNPSKPQIQPQIQSVPPPPQQAEDSLLRLKNNLKIVLRDFNFPDPSTNQWLKILWRLLMTNMKKLIHFKTAMLRLLSELNTCRQNQFNSLIATIILLISENTEEFDKYKDEFIKKITELSESKRIEMIDWLPQLIIAFSTSKSIKTIEQVLDPQSSLSSMTVEKAGINSASLSPTVYLSIPDQIVDCLIQANSVLFIMTVNEMSYSSYYSNFAPIISFIKEIRSRPISSRRNNFQRDESMIREYEKSMGWIEQCQKDIDRLKATVSCHQLMYKSAFRQILPAELNSVNMSSIEELFEFCIANNPVFFTPEIHMTDYNSVTSFLYRKHEHVMGISIDSDGHNEAELRMNLFNGDTKVMQLVSPEIYSLSKREKILTETFKLIFSKQAAAPTRSECFYYPRSFLIHENLMMVESPGFIGLTHLIQQFNIPSRIQEVSQSTTRTYLPNVGSKPPIEIDPTDGSFVNNGVKFSASEDSKTPSYFYEKKQFNIPDYFLFKWLLNGSEGSKFDFLFIRQSFTSYYGVSTFLHFIFQTQVQHIPSIMLFKDRQRICIPDFFFNKCERGNVEFVNCISKQYIITSDQLIGAIPRFMMYGAFSTTWQIFADSLYQHRERIRIVMRALVHQEQRLYMDSKEQIQIFESQKQLNNPRIQQYAEYLNKDMEMVGLHKNIMSKVYQKIDKISSMAMTEETEKCDEVFPFIIMDHLIENSWNVVKAQPIACGWM